MENVLKFPTLYSILFCLNFAFYAQFHKILSGIAHSVDPDQTASEGAVLSGSALSVILSDTLVLEILGHYCIVFYIV